MLSLKRAMLVLGLLAGTSQGATGMDIRDPRALMTISEYGAIRNAVLDLRNLSEARKFILVDALTDMLADNRKLRLDGYVFQAGEPDLRIVARRAEWFIDQVLLLPREAEISTRNLNERIELWKAVTALRHTVSPGQAEVLRIKYVGRILIGIVPGKAHESIQNLENFLDEWFPYGKSLQEMERILDIKLPVRGGEAVLRIDSGFSGKEYRFLHDGSTIRAVKTTSIN
jgi:hypothetical protein